MQGEFNVPKSSIYSMDVKTYHSPPSQLSNLNNRPVTVDWSIRVGTHVSATNFDHLQQVTSCLNIINKCMFTQLQIIVLFSTTFFTKTSYTFNLFESVIICNTRPQRNFVRSVSKYDIDNPTHTTVIEKKVVSYTILLCVTENVKAVIL